MTRDPLPNDDLISSTSNQLIKRVRSLHSRQTRQMERLSVVEGWKLLLDLYRQKIVPEAILVREDEDRSRLPAELISITRAVAAKVFDGLATTVQPQGILAVVPFPSPALPNHERPLILVLDQIRDPGNMGTLIRSAVAAECTAVLLAGNCVDPMNDKAIRAGMGAQWFIPVLDMKSEEARELLSACDVVAGATASAEKSYEHVDWTKASAIVVGSESHGITPATVSYVTESVSIPLSGQIESLNAAVAGSVMLFEAQRQRRSQT